MLELKRTEVEKKTILLIYPVSGFDSSLFRPAYNSLLKELNEVREEM